MKIESYEDLQQIYKKNIEKFKSEEILKPKTWGGYILKPQSFEFWSSHASQTPSCAPTARGAMAQPLTGRKGGAAALGAGAP